MPRPQLCDAVGSWMGQAVWPWFSIAVREPDTAERDGPRLAPGRSNRIGAPCRGELMLLSRFRCAVAHGQVRTAVQDRRVMINRCVTALANTTLGVLDLARSLKRLFAYLLPAIGDWAPSRLTTVAHQPN